MYLVFKNYLFKEFCGLYLNTYMEKYQSPCHNSLDLIISIITTKLEIVPVFMHQLDHLKQAIEFSVTEGYTFRTTFHKNNISISTLYPYFQKL